MDTPLCVEAGSAAFFFFFQAVRFTSETPAGQVFTSESNEACKTFKLSMKRGAPSEKMMWFSILFGIHVIFMPSIFAIERNRRLASYPLRLWKTTRMGSCSRLSVGLCCKRCALPAVFPCQVAAILHRPSVVLDNQRLQAVQTIFLAAFYPLVHLIQWLLLASWPNEFFSL